MTTGRTVEPGDASAPATDALNEHLHSALESMPDGFVLLDAEWRFLYVNAMGEKMLRRRRDTLLGKNMWDEFPEGVGSVAEREYQRVLREGGSTTFEIDYSPLGRRLEVRAHAIKAGGLALYFRDITERHAIAERAQLLQAAVTQLDDMVVITSAANPAEGSLPPAIFANPAFERISGYSSAELEGRSPRFMRGPQTNVAKLQALLDELVQGRPGRCEIIFHGKDGRPIWVDLQAAPFGSPSGEATHVVLVGRDITSAKHAENELRELNERFRIVARATADVVWDWNLADDTIWWGDGMGVRFGYYYQGKTPIAESWIKNIHEEDRRRVARGIRAVIDGGGENWSDEYRFVRADGSIAQVTDRGVVMRDAGGRAVRMVGAMVDVTEQRALEARLRQSQRLEAVGQLTGGVAHDFNNLLTVILSNAELLEMRLASDERSRMLAEMTRMAAERGAELTNRLLAFSRNQALDPKPTDVAALVRAMEGLLARALGEQTKVDIHAQEGLWSALIDTLQLETAILNLCINARDAMPDGGVVRIEMSNVRGDKSGDCVLVSVGDTGTGMDEATAARAFEPFFTTKDVGKGSGLGLSMVYGFVMQSKGRVEIETALGEGTRIKLYLPRGVETSDNVAAHAKLEVEGGNERVLLVEDDDLVRMQVSTELTTLGYRVVTARNGVEALEMLRTAGPFDLLFTDVVMAGGMNGREVVEAAKQIAPDLPVLYTSGNPDIILSDEGHLASGTLLLRKPYKRRDLARKLREALGES